MAGDASQQDISAPEETRQTGGRSGSSAAAATARESTSEYRETREGARAEVVALLAEATTYKERGNEALGRRELENAMDSYQRAYDCLGQISRWGRKGADAAHCGAAHELLTALLNNMALARLKAGEACEESHDRAGARANYETTVVLTEHVLKLDSQNAKAIYRRAKATARLSPEGSGGLTHS